MCLSQRQFDRGAAKLFIWADTKVLICGIWAQRRIPCRLCMQRGPCGGSNVWRGFQVAPAPCSRVYVPSTLFLTHAPPDGESVLTLQRCQRRTAQGMWLLEAGGRDGGFSQPLSHQEEGLASHFQTHPGTSLACWSSPLCLLHQDCVQSPVGTDLGGETMQGLWAGLPLCTLTAPGHSPKCV